MPLWVLQEYMRGIKFNNRQLFGLLVGFGVAMLKKTLTEGP